MRERVIMRFSCWVGSTTERCRDVCAPDSELLKLLCGRASGEIDLQAPRRQRPPQTSARPAKPEEMGLVALDFKGQKHLVTVDVAKKLIHAGIVNINVPKPVRTLPTTRNVPPKIRTKPA